MKDASGQLHAEGSIPATRYDLDHWMNTLPQAWSAAMEATLFTGWIYDHRKPRAVALKVAHPLMLRAIAAAKRKNDRIDANKICDWLRSDFLPECYMIGAGAPKNITVNCVAVADGIKVSVDGLDAVGAATHNEWIGKFDGKDCPVIGDPTSDKRADL